MKYILLILYNLGSLVYIKLIHDAWDNCRYQEIHLWNIRLERAKLAKETLSLLLIL